MIEDTSEKSDAGSIFYGREDWDCRKPASSRYCLVFTIGTCPCTFLHDAHRQCRDSPAKRIG